MTADHGLVAGERDCVAAASHDFTERLSNWLAIPSISADPDHHQDVAASARWLADALHADGWPVAQVWDDGPALPAVYACWPAADPAAPTVLVYGHHDVQPVDPVAEWEHPPFEPVVIGDELFGRGASDDKGHVLMHLLAMRAHLAATGANAPAVTVKLLVEGEEEAGSPHILQTVRAHRSELDCDLVVVSDTGMFHRDTPSMCTGMRGMLTMEIALRGASVDLHSGQFGGAVPNPVTALARLLAGLHDDDGRVAVAGFYDDVREPSAAERAAFAGLPFDEPGWLAGPAGGARATAGEAGWSTVERLWVRPTAEINGISGGYTGPGVKTIVPRDASAKLSFRLVPGQRPDDIRAKVLAHLRAAAPAGLTLDVLGEQGAVAPCHSDIDHPATVAVRAALAEAFGTAMLFSREGGSGPEAEIQEELGGVPLTFLGVGLPDDRIHAPGERVTLSLLHRGAHAAATLWRTLPAASPPHAG